MSKKKEKYSYNDIRQKVRREVNFELNFLRSQNRVLTEEIISLRSKLDEKEKQLQEYESRIKLLEETSGVSKLDLSKLHSKSSLDSEASMLVDSVYDVLSKIYK